MTAQDIARWQQWLGVIRVDVARLHRYRFIFREVRSMAAANPAVRELRTEYWEYFWATWAHYGATAVRRQSKIDERSGSISLARLLDKVAKSPHVPTRAWFGHGGMPADAFDEFAAASSDTLDPARVASDLTRLQNTAGPVADYADQVVAHLDKRLPKKTPRLRDVDAAVDLLIDLFCKYHRLIERSNYLIDRELPIGDDWKEVFKHAWIS